MFETSSEEEAGGTDSVVDVEDLGNIMGHMKKAKVLLSGGYGMVGSWSLSSWIDSNVTDWI